MRTEQENVEAFKTWYASHRPHDCWSAWQEATRQAEERVRRVDSMRNVERMVMDNLAQAVKRLVRELRKTDPDNEFSEKALDYLRRRGLLDSPLRSEPEQISEAEQATWHAGLNAGIEIGRNNQRIEDANPLPIPKSQIDASIERARAFLPDGYAIVHVGQATAQAATVKPDLPVAPAQAEPVMWQWRWRRVDAKAGIVGEWSHWLGGQPQARAGEGGEWQERGLYPIPAPGADRDAYEGARADLDDWKRRALRAESRLRALGWTGVAANQPPAQEAQAAEPDWLQRLRQEQSELQERNEKLKTFIARPAFRMLDEDSRNLLERQFNQQFVLLQTLNQRLNNGIERHCRSKNHD